MKVQALQSLSKVLWIELAVVQQHFIHVLTLEAWNLAGLSRKIVDVDAVDLPNALRIIDGMVREHQLPDQSKGLVLPEESFPSPGATLMDVLKSELFLDRQLEGALQASLDESAGGIQLSSQLLEEPLAVRRGYQEWLMHELRNDRNGHRISGGPDSVDSMAIDAHFAVLMRLINQTIIHSFVHWHSGNRDLADRLWFVSGIAMMQAAKLTKLLAKQGRPANPLSRFVLDSLPDVRLSLKPQASITHDIDLMDTCRKSAATSSNEAQDGDLIVVLREIERYFRNTRADFGNVHDTEIVNPCSGFDRMYQAYVERPDAGQKSA